MGIPRLFKTPRHQKFEYRPMHFDPLKEEVEKKKSIYDGEEGGAEIVKSRISQGFRSKSKSFAGSEYQKQAKRANYLRLMIMALLILLCFLFLQTYLPSLSKWLS